MDTSLYHFWKQGHIELPWKDNQHQDLEYKRTIYNSAADYGWQEYRDAGFTNKYYTGKMYDMTNPEPEWMGYETLKQIFPFEDIHWCFYNLSPGEVLPEHTDKYARLVKNFDTKSRTIVRTVIFLDDWKQGHYLEMDRNPIVNWKAGDYVMWTSTLRHCAANLGFDERYTLQLTGFLKL
jgi:aspartyl/asparaginyl beta-hydroxylase (cupin superfamily)